MQYIQKPHNEDAGYIIIGCISRHTHTKANNTNKNKLSAKPQSAHSPTPLKPIQRKLAWL